jgi:splicing factor 3B subunit 5
MADKLRTTQQLEALQNKYIGTGHADTTKFEWTSNIARDSYASYVGHPPLLQYMTLAMGETSREEMRVKLIEKMVRPVGPPPEVSGQLKRILKLYPSGVLISKQVQE